MDLLKRLGGFLGGVGNQAQRTIGGIGGGANQAFQQAQRAFRPVAQQVQRNIPRPPVIPRIQVPVIPKIQLPPIPQFRPPAIPQFRPPALPQAPKIDFNAANQALSNYYGRTALSKTPQNFGAVSRALQDINTRNQQRNQQQTQMIKESPGTAIVQAAAGSLLGAPRLLSDITKTFTGRETPKFDATKAVENVGNVISQTPIRKVPGYGIASEVVKPIFKQTARYVDVAGGQEQYSKGLKGTGEALSDIATVASLFYSGGLAKQLGAKGTAFLPTATKLAPRLAASGAGQNILQQLSEGKKLNELDPKQVALAAAAYTGLGIGVPGIARGAGTITSKALGKTQGTVTSKLASTPTYQDVPASYLKPKAPQPGGAPLGQKGLTPQLPKIDVTSPEALALKPKNVAISKLKSIAGDRELALQDYNAGRYSMTDLPVLVKIEKNGSLTVLDGNGRIIAAQQAGQTNIPITTNEKLYREILDAREKLPSMYGKGSIGQDVPESFFQPKQTPADQLDELRAQVDISKEALDQNPAAELMKYANKRTMELPEVIGGGKGKFGKTGDGIVQELGFADSETARRAFDDYAVQRELHQELVGKLKDAQQLVKSTPVKNILPIQEKTRGFTKSVQTSPEVSPEFAKLASGTYEGVTKKQTLANTQKLFEGKDINAVQTDIMTRVNSKKAPDAQTISDTIALMKNYDAAGNHEAANAIQQQIAEKLTQSGQTVWAASLLHNRTPEGVLYGARRALNTAGVDITPELEKSLQGAIGKIRTTKGADKDMAIKEMQRLVAQQIPSSFGEKAVALWKAGLLTGIKTQTGNATSNISSIALKKLSDPLAASIDATLGLVTGERKKTATLRGLFSGTKEGFKKAGTFMKTGIDERTGMTNKFDLKLVNYGKGLTGRAAQGYTDFVFKLMGAADRPYYYATLRNNLNDIAIAQAKNGGFKGAERATFIKKFVDTPPEYALQTAIDAAEKSIFANDTLLSGLASGLKTKAGKFEPVVDAIMPFTKVPSAVITRVFDYTPAGAVKTVAKQIASGKLDQRALSEGLAEAGTGTAAIWMGYQLSQAGLMTGPYPKDPKEQDLWVLEGKQPYSIKVGDKWLSMNYTSPIGQVLAIGDDMSIAQKNGESFGGQVVAGALGGAKAVVSQSFLQGTSALLDAVNDPQRSADKYVKQQVASIVPTLINDVAKVADPFQREANNAYEAAIARVPFLSKTLNPKRDVFGNPVQQKSPNALDTLINPFRPSQIPTPTDLGNELRRLQDEKLGTMPDISGKDFFGKNTTVDKSQINKIQSELGPQIQTAWSNAIKDPRYSKLTDDEKKRALDKIKSDITAAYKAGNAENYGQTWTGKLTKDQGAIYGGQEAGLSVPGQAKPKTPKISKTLPKPKKWFKKGRKAKVVKTKMPKIRKVTTRKAPASPKAPKVGKVKGFAKLRPTKSARKTIKIKTG